MTSWANIAKKGHEKSIEREIKRVEYLDSLNQFKYVKPRRFNRADTQNNILLLTKVFDSNILRNIYDYVGKQYQYFVDENVIYNGCIIYAGFNIMDEWYLDEDEFPPIYKSYKEYRKYSSYLDDREIKEFYGNEFATKKYIEYDLRTFYYRIFYENNHLIIRFYKNKKIFDNCCYRGDYVIKDFNHIKTPEAINHHKRFNTVVNKIFVNIKKN